MPNFQELIKRTNQLQVGVSLQVLQEIPMRALSSFLSLTLHMRSLNAKRYFENMGAVLATLVTLHALYNVFRKNRANIQGFYFIGGALVASIITHFAILSMTGLRSNQHIDEVSFKNYVSWTLLLATAELMLRTFAPHPTPQRAHIAAPAGAPVAAPAGVVAVGVQPQVFFAAQPAAATNNGHPPVRASHVESTHKAKST